jgi:hypothetical protein
LNSGRRLVIIYAGLTALLDLVVLLPGNPDFSSGWGFVGAVAIQTLIVWRVWHGSAVAWVIAFLTAAMIPVAVLLIGGPVGYGIVVLTAVSLVQAATLVAPPMVRRVWPIRETPASSR